MAVKDPLRGPFILFFVFLREAFVLSLDQYSAGSADTGAAWSTALLSPESSNKEEKILGPLESGDWSGRKLELEFVTGASFNWNWDDWTNWRPVIVVTLLRPRHQRRAIKWPEL